MISSHQIEPNMLVVCSKGRVFAEVDRLVDPATIRLARDRCGRHHYIPRSWVTSVDDKCHLDRSSDQAMREWSMTSTTQQAGGENPDAAMLADPLHVERVRSQQSEEPDSGR
jgi:hypothetical protein